MGRANSLKQQSLLPLLALGLGLMGCPIFTERIFELNPHPRVALDERAPPVTVDVGAISDDAIGSDVAALVREWRRTLENGFRNAAGARFVPRETANAARLVFAQADLEGNNGRFRSLRYRASWFAPDGRLLAEAAGEAMPRDRERRAYSNEDVIEVMYEQLFARLPR
ncbi:MAG TPA: hypothetical protein VFF06_36330 [Polyangia bacterium]|nr:hypothetical protein [Polyangia bacterium]